MFRICTVIKGGCVMSTKGLWTVFFTLIVLMSCFDAYAQKSKQNYEIMRLIRHEKFNLILPGALRDNNVDMWIHVVESGNRDPLAFDLGGWFEFRLWEPIGYYLFYRPGWRQDREDNPGWLGPGRSLRYSRLGRRPVETGGGTRSRNDRCQHVELAYHSQRSFIYCIF